MYQLENISFDHRGSHTDHDYCRACGKILLFDGNLWSVKRVVRDKEERVIVRFPREGWEFISVAGSPYPVCTECLEKLRNKGFEEMKQIVFRLLHPNWQHAIKVLFMKAIRAEIEKDAEKGLQELKRAFDMVRNI